MPRRTLILLLLVACQKHDDRPGTKSFLEKYRKAAQDRDARAMIELYSRSSRQTLLAYAESTLRVIQSSPDEAQKLRASLPWQTDPAKCASAEAFLFAMTEARLADEKERRSMSEARWRDESIEGDRAVLRTEDPSNGRTIDTVLVWEDGAWKMDLDATTKRNQSR